MRPSSLLLYLLLVCPAVACGGTAVQPDQSVQGAQSGGASSGGDSTSSSGGAGESAGGTQSAGGTATCANAEVVEDDAVKAALLPYAPEATSWTQEAWDSLTEAPPTDLSIVGAQSLAGLQCLDVLFSLELVGGDIDDLSPLASWGPANLHLTGELLIADEAWSALADSEFPSHIHITDVDWPTFPAIHGLGTLYGVHVENASLGALDGLAGVELGQAEFLNVTGLTGAEVAKVTGADTLNLSESTIDGTLDLSSFSNLRELFMDDAVLDSMPIVPAPSDACNRIHARRVNIPEAELQIAAQALCDIGWAVKYSSGADGQESECGMSVCR